MTGVRVLVGTQKGAFVLTADGRRTDWEVSGPHFGGWEIYHLVGAPTTRPGSTRRSRPGGSARSSNAPTTGVPPGGPVGNQFSYDGPAGTHQWYDGTPHPWEFARVWHLEPSPTDPDTVYAGVEDAALFRSTDGAESWEELAGLRTQESGPGWQPGAGGMCTHTVLIDPTDADRMHVAISAAGVFRSDDAGATWRPANHGLHSEGIPDPDAEVGHCVHRIARHPRGPTRCSCRSTGT